MTDERTAGRGTPSSGALTGALGSETRRGAPRPYDWGPPRSQHVWICLRRESVQTEHVLID